MKSSRALEEQEYATLLKDAAFEDVSLEPTRVCRAADAKAFFEEAGVDAERLEGRRELLRSHLLQRVGKL